MSFETEKFEFEGSKTFLEGKGAIIISPHPRRMTEVRSLILPMMPSQKPIKIRQASKKIAIRPNRKKYQLLKKTMKIPRDLVLDKGLEPSYQLAARPRTGSEPQRRAKTSSFIMGGGRLKLSGSFFGEDRLAFIEGTSDPDWLENVNIVGDGCCLVRTGWRIDHPALMRAVTLA